MQKSLQYIIPWIAAIVFLSNSIGMQRLQAQQVSLIRFYRIGGSFQFKFLHDTRIQPLKSTHPFYKETLTLRNKGYFVSPKILELEWGAVLGLTQDRYYSSYFKRKANGKFINGFFNGTFFKKSSYPITLIWNKANQNMIFNYGGYNNYQLQKFQINFTFNRFWIPSNFWVETRSFDENWYQFDRVVRRSQTQQLIHYSGSRQNDKREINILYKLRNIKDHINSERNYMFQNARFSFKQKLNAEKSNIWSSALAFFDRQSRLRRYSTINANTDLQLKHRYGFSSDYHYSYINMFSSDYTANIHNGLVALHHQLFQSLASYISLNGNYQKLTAGKEKSYAINRGITYNKNLPFKSKLQISYKVANGKNDRRMESILMKKVGESHLILNETPVFLDEMNIIASSIVVYNSEGDIFYEEGEDKDYIVEQVGDLTQIIRTPFSRIEPEQVILVDYEFKTAPTMAFTTHTRSVNASFNIKKILLYYRENQHRQTLISGQPISSDFLQNLHFRTFGIKLRLRSDTKGISLIVENKEYNSTKVFYKQLSSVGGFFIRPSLNTLFLIRGNWYRIEYPRSRQQMDLYSIHGEYNWYPTTLFSVQLFGNYRFQKNPLAETQLTKEYGGFALWQWGIMRLKISYSRQYWQYASRTIRLNRFYLEFERYF